MVDVPVVLAYSCGEDGVWRPSMPEEEAALYKAVVEHGILHLADRFWANVTQLEYGCWLFGRLPLPKGYRTFKLSERVAMPAYRFAYMLVHGWIDGSIDVHHQCEHKYCVNPAHLEGLTRSEHFLKHRGLDIGDVPLDEELPYPGVGVNDKGQVLCSRGHPYDRVAKSGERRCRICAAIARRRRNQQLREQALAPKAS